MRFDRALVGVGAATALLLALPGPALAAPAAPAPAPVDVEARATLEDDLIYPGGTLQLRAIADVESGEVAKLGVKVALPAGVTYVRAGGDGDAANADCTPSADGRTVTCVPHDGQTKLVSASVYLKAGADLAPGTRLPFTVTADIGDAVDTKPENNTASATAEVRAPGDLSLKWEVPAGPVRTGQKVQTRVLVTNLGPAPVKFEALRLHIPGDYFPTGDDASCWAEPATVTCDHFRELAPGATLTYPFTWTFPKEAAGTTYKVEARINSSSPLDPNTANDKSTASFIIKKAAGPGPKPTPTPTRTATPTPTPSVSTSPAPAPAPQTGGGDGELANTGSAPLTTLAGTAAALAAAGVLLARTRTRTRIRTTQGDRS